MMELLAKDTFVIILQHVYQINTLNTLNLYNVIYELYLNKIRKIFIVHTSHKLLLYNQKHFYNELVP